LCFSLRQSIIDGDIENSLKYANECIKASMNPLEVLNKCVVAGVLELGDKWIRGEAFIADLVAAAEAAKVVIPILKNEIVKRGGKLEYVGRAVIGTVEGDIHDIGKTIVATIWEVNGIEVIDLGVDVPPQKFVEAVKQYNPDIVGMSALLTTTMVKQKETIEALKAAGLRDKVKVIVGGAPTSAEWAREIGADGWAPDAISSIDVVMKWLREKRSAVGEAHG